MDFAKSALLFGALLQLVPIYVEGAENDSSLEALWNLTGYAIQSRQRYPDHPSQFFNRPIPSYINKFQPAGNLPMYAGHYDNFQRPFAQNQGSYRPQNQGGYGLIQPQFSHLGPVLGRPEPNKGPLASLLPSREAFMEALDSIARNDELRCVPRILCEVTSGTLSARQSGLKLPFNIDMSSIVGLLSGFNGVELNPLLSFGKAALLGYSSQGNAGTCMYAYPECPRDPDRLVEYLNNYNGGFFRFFNGISPQFQPNRFPGQLPPHFYQRPQYPGSYQQAGNLYRPQGFFNYGPNEAQKRILTGLADSDFAVNRFPDVRQQKGIKFPNEQHPNNIHYDDSTRTLKFPIREEADREGHLRQSKRLRGPYQRPSAAHRPTPMIFPDRTGTGELRFTPEELRDDFQNNNLVSFEPETNNDYFYFTNGLQTHHHHGLDDVDNHFFPS